MSKVHFWSGMKPRVGDMEELQDYAHENANQKFRDTFKDGVLKGYLEELEVYVPDPSNHGSVKVKSGAAYINGLRVEVNEEQTVNLDEPENEPNIVYIKHVYVDDDFRQHPITGESYPCRKIDSYQIEAVRESQFNGEGRLALAKIGVDQQGQLYAIDLRQYLRLKPEVLSVEYDTEPPSPPTIQSVSTGIESVAEGRVDNLPQYAWVSVTWIPSSDDLGIAYYRIVWMPLDENYQPLPVKRRERTVAFRQSPINTHYTFHGIPLGEVGAVYVQAVDKRGNESEWAISEPIVAGGDENLDTAPSINLISQELGVRLNITPMTEAAGYEVYVDYDNIPSINGEKLFYRGPRTVHFIKAKPGTVVHVRVRAYNRSGLYSPFTSSYASAGEAKLIDETFQEIQSMKAEILAARGNMASLHERIARIVDPSGFPTPAVAVRQVSFDLQRSVDFDFGAGAKKVV
ncbi:MAG: hypothetical protein QI197_07365, partial [Candidatus Korarchaeota archaeon]|nr:hypothetical protein [Candidatus Korarchaeota archaeon]